MKSTEFYKRVKGEFGPGLQAMGFSLSKGASCLWRAEFGLQHVALEFVAGKCGWIEPFGSNFRIRIAVGGREGDQPFPSKVLDRDPRSVRLLEVFDVAAIKRFCEVRNAVIDKGLSRKPGDVVGMIGSVVDSGSKRLEKLKPPFPMVETDLPWIDVEDLREWASFLSSISEGMIERIAKIVKLDQRERNGLLLACWKAADGRSEEEKTLQRVQTMSEIMRSSSAIGTIDRALRGSKTVKDRS
jgi:hypothetical protein